MTMELLYVVISVLTGAGFISLAIDNFERKKYFCFGYEIMAAISMAAMMVISIVRMYK